MTFTSLRKVSLKVARTAHIALICVMVAYSPMASSIEIVLGTNMKVRTGSDEGLAVAGVLRKGSIVEIPDQYAVRGRNGKVDAEASFNKWLRDASYSNAQITKRVRDGRQDFFYPIRIKSVAGQPNSRLKNQTLFMALRVLERSRGGLRVKEDSRAYKGSPALQPLRGLPRVAPVARPARPTPSARPARESVSVIESPVTVQEETASPAQEEPPVYTPSAEDQSEDQAPQETSTEATDASGDCADCQLPQSTADDLARTVREQVDAADLAASRGLPGLSSQFPSTCRDGRFINSDGSYGPLGAEILKQLRRNPDAFMRNSAAGRACPNFKNWVDENGRPDEARRMHFWVYLMTAVFAKESTCRVAPPIHRGPDGMLCGLGQMPCDENRNGDDNRDMRLSPTCTGNQSNASNNIRCSIGRLEYAIRDGTDPYVASGNYWQVLRTEPRGMTKALISQYPGCGAASFNVPGSRGGRRSHKARTSKSGRRHTASARHGRHS